MTDAARRMQEVYDADPSIGRYKLMEAAGVGERVARRFLDSQRRRAPQRQQPIHIAHLTDWHIPYHDEKALDVSFKLCRRIQPRYIVIHEIHDFYALSSFDKDPKRAYDLQPEIDCAKQWLQRLRKDCPKATIILLESNHLDRLRRYLWSQAPALAGLRALELENLLDLRELRIELKESWTFKGFLFKHGDLVRKDSAVTAKHELEKEGVSGASGHTHRLGAHYKTRRGGEYVWLESGCLCDLRPEYAKGVVDWQQGLSVVTFEPEGTQFVAQPIPIINGKIMWGNEVIS